MNYDYTDRVIAYIDKQLITRYSRLKSLMSFDELNVMQEVRALYDSILVMVREAYLKLANRTYTSNSRRKKQRILDELWIDHILSGYDSVSKYVFMSEIDRKCARLAEAIIASPTKVQEIDAAMRSMSLMCRIYAVRVTDEAVLQAFRDEDEDLVRWVAEKDEKTCSVCYRRDGKIYSIDELPSKPHINCRCVFERI